MDLFRTRRLVGRNDDPYIDLLGLLARNDLRDNRLLFLDKETIQETEVKIIHFIQRKPDEHTVYTSGGTIK